MRYTSFIVRLWLPGDEPNPNQAGYHGSVEHIQSGASARVGSLEEIQRFMQRWLTGTLLVKEGREKNENPQ